MKFVYGYLLLLGLDDLRIFILGFNRELYVAYNFLVFIISYVCANE